jgi:hypothetical protein
MVHIPEHPCVQGSMRREASGRGAACLHQPDLFWLWRHRLQGLVHSLALLPGLRNQPAPGPACTGTSLHRDHNAARNIERAGQALRGAVA